MGNQASEGGAIRIVDLLSGLELVNTQVVYTRAGQGIVARDDPGERSIRYSDFFENEGGDCDCVWGDPVGSDGTLALDPMFTAYTGDPSTDDLSLAEGSPCIDAGDPEILDGDGSRSDIGSTGGTDWELMLEDADEDEDGASFLGVDWRIAGRSRTTPRSFAPVMRPRSIRLRSRSTGRR